MNIEDIETKPKENDVSFFKRCSDYDDECIDVTDPIGCWIGGNRVCRNGKLTYMDRADGYCPYAQHCN